VTVGDYRVQFAASARRAVNARPIKSAAATVEFCFTVLVRDPYRVGKPLRSELAGKYAARRGDYRVIYEIDDPTQLVHVLRIEHRRDVYRAR
jgi:mRNA interferase RelE/StbE